MNQNTYHIFFSNFANPLRINIISCLKDKNMSVSELASELNVEQSKVSHSLSSLRACNIVDVKQLGKSRIYSLNKKTIVPILRLIDKHAITYCKNKCASISSCKGCGR